MSPLKPESLFKILPLLTHLTSQYLHIYLVLQIVVKLAAIKLR